MSDLPAGGRFEGREHVLPVRVYYESTDLTGVVYHAEYLRFLERGRTEFLRLAGFGHAEHLEGEAPTAFAVTRMALRWLKPARVDDALTVRTAYDRLKGARISGWQRVWKGGDLLLEAEVEAVCITPEGRPKRAPAPLIAALRPYLLPEVG